MANRRHLTPEKRARIARDYARLKADRGGGRLLPGDLLDLADRHGVYSGTIYGAIRRHNQDAQETAHAAHDRID
jgi:transposase-like protein